MKTDKSRVYLWNRSMAWTVLCGMLHKGHTWKRPSELAQSFTNGGTVVLNTRTAAVGEFRCKYEHMHLRKEILPL